ncbi:two component transcriptional regulator, LytTR family [Paludibacter propionicigenes WB4]|uniref:Two component transcriptional regulator, LytTR family n=1 Tax=Paludibacter propionicigenes (strain DSM 17365 / JCM 13257 / WB4) TaxID=694427 RepID=E4T7X9_PALPW|nr:LytTR family DNA-binding domain-containing protein [Paludibacter propionicigenes]ADQ80823.1 two component transcriptional regulator, LytTR family [Paludibacter propionicigenes WB4]
MTLSCFIIDDEPLALGLLENYVSKTPFLKLTGKFSSAISASSAVSDTPPDVIFLDIQMAELNGMEFARLVPEKSKIIFTTAFQQYAIEGYKVNALDYLLKPFSYSDFLLAANKALQWQQTLEKALNQPDCIYVKSDYKLIQIQLSKILYIEGLKDYLKIYIEDQALPIVSHITMKTMEEMLPGQLFMRVHRSFIVHKEKIKIVENNRIIFGKVYIPVSDSYKESFQSFLEKRMLV